MVSHLVAMRSFRILRVRRRLRVHLEIQPIEALPRGPGPRKFALLLQAASSAPLPRSFVSKDRMAIYNQSIEVRWTCCDPAEVQEKVKQREHGLGREADESSERGTAG